MLGTTGAGKPGYRWAPAGRCPNRLIPLPFRGLTGIAPGGTLAASGIDHGKPVTLSGRPGRHLKKHVMPYPGFVGWGARDRQISVWSKRRALPSGEYQEQWYEAMSAPRAGAWGKPHRFFEEKSSHGELPLSDQRVLTDARGDVLLAGTDPSDRLTLATHRLGSSSTRVRKLSATAYDVYGAMAPDGSALLVWLGTGGLNGAYVSAKWRVGKAHGLSHTTTDVQPSVSINRRGQGLITWTTDTTDVPNVLWTASTTGSGRFVGPHVLTLSSAYYFASNWGVLNDRGQAAVSWLRIPDHSGSAHLLIARGNL